MLMMDGETLGCCFRLERRMQGHRLLGKILYGNRQDIPLFIEWTQLPSAHRWWHRDIGRAALGEYFPHGILNVLMDELLIGKALFLKGC